MRAAFRAPDRVRDVCSQLTGQAWEVGRVRSSLASLALLLGAAAAILSAVITDVASGEHPTHTALLIASAGAVLALCWWRRTRAASARAAACSAVIVGPLLHLSAKRPPAPFPLDHGQPLHILGAEFPSAVMQIAIVPRFP